MKSLQGGNHMKDKHKMLHCYKHKANKTYNYKYVQVWCQKKHTFLKPHYAKDTKQKKGIYCNWYIFCYVVMEQNIYGQYFKRQRWSVYEP